MPSIAIRRSYEAIYILDPSLGDEQIAVITTKYKQLVETNGGTVEKIDVWERRKLAYPIKKMTEGIYVVMQFTSEAKAEVELRRVFQISEDQLRFMIVKPEEIDAAPSAIEAPQPVAQAQAPALEEAPLASEPEAQPELETPTDPEAVPAEETEAIAA